MNGREYKRMTLAEMKTRRWRTTGKLTRGDGSSIPKGAEVKIEDKHNGLTIVGLPCECCGCELGIRKVSPGGVEEITGEGASNV